MNHEKDEQRFLWNLKSKIQEHFNNNSLKTHYFKDFSRTLSIQEQFKEFKNRWSPCIYTELFEKLYTILRKKEPRRQDITNFSFKMFKMRFLRSSKYSKTTVELTFTTQKANTCSPWTDCSVFEWKYPFWVNLIQKPKIVSLSWNLVLRLIQICKIPWRCSFFLFSTRNTFLSKFDSKNQSCQFVLKFGT